jgi:ribose-phosphate pyrophosphokinase
MAAAAALLQASGMRAPVCIGVHALFCGDALETLLAAGAGRIVTCNSIAHATNAIDIRPELVKAVGDLLAGVPGAGAASS